MLKGRLRERFQITVLKIYNCNNTVTVTVGVITEIKSPLRYLSHHQLD